MVIVTRAPQRRLLLQLAPLCLLVAHCSEAPCTPPDCDIRKADCQEEIMAATACLRGTEPRAVPVQVVSADDYISARIAALEPDEYATGEAISLALSYLGLAEAVSLDMQIDKAYSQIAAFYSPSNEEVTILDRGNDDGNVSLLVHEFVHALQYGDPERLPTAQGPSFDARLAASAMREGEAMLLSDKANVLLLGQEPDNINWIRVYNAFVGNSEAEYLHNANKVDEANRHFTYSHGARFITEAYQVGGNAAVHDWVQHPPGSTFEVLRHFEAYASPVEYADPATLALPLWDTVTGFEDSELLYTDQLGHFVLSAQLADLEYARFVVEEGGPPDVPWSSYAPKTQGYRQGLGQASTEPRPVSDTLSLWRSGDTLLALQRLRFSDSTLQYDVTRRDEVSELFEVYLPTRAAANVHTTWGDEDSYSVLTVIASADLSATALADLAEQLTQWQTLNHTDARALRTSASDAVARLLAGER